MLLASISDSPLTRRPVDRPSRIPGTATMRPGATHQHAEPDQSGLDQRERYSLPVVGSAFSGSVVFRAANTSRSCPAARRRMVLLPLLLLRVLCPRTLRRSTLYVLRPLLAGPLP